MSHTRDKTPPFFPRGPKGCQIPRVHAEQIARWNAEQADEEYRRLKEEARKREREAKELMEKASERSKEFQEWRKHLTDEEKRRKAERARDEERQRKQQEELRDLREHEMGRTGINDSKEEISPAPPFENTLRKIWCLEVSPMGGGRKGSQVE